MRNEDEFPTVRADQQEAAPTVRREQEEGAVPPTVPLGEAAPGFVPGARVEAETVVLGGPPPILAWLVITRGPRAGRLFRLNPSGTTVGRDSSNDVILDDPAVSRHHAKIRVEKGEGDEEQFFLYDLASENGTFVNGEQIVKQAINDGDEIVMGQTNLVFKKV